MVEEVLQEAERKMRKAVDTTGEEFSTVRTGKASTSLLSRVMVDYYGQPTPLNQISSISAPEPSLLIVAPYDKSVIKDVERAILQADLGINPANDGQVLRLPIPKLTEERRKEMIKMVHVRAEEGKVAVRNVRREGIEDLRAFEKESEITKDDLNRGQKEIQKLTDGFVHEIDEMLKTKEKELMEV
jgi:ribosome recycling factor